MLLKLPANFSNLILRMRLQRSQSQIYLSFQLSDLPLYGISSKQILFQDCARPSSKGSGVNTIYPISYGQNSIKIIERSLVGFTVSGSMFQNGTNWILVKFSAIENVAKMFGYSRSFCSKKVCYLLLGKPYSVSFECKPGKNPWRVWRQSLVVMLPLWSYKSELLTPKPKAYHHLPYRRSPSSPRR